MAGQRPKSAPAPNLSEGRGQEGAHIEELLDEALEETFPASDPPAFPESAVQHRKPRKSAGR